MNPHSDEPRISELFRQLKDADQAAVPDFESVLERPLAPTSAVPWRPMVAAACCLVVVVLGGLWLASGRRTPPDNPDQPATARSNGELGPATAAGDDLDFDRLQTSIDNLFETAKAPDWNTPTDALFEIAVSE